MRYLIALALCSGCLSSNSVECSDGRLCPTGTQCDDIHALCVTGAQTTVCTSLLDGDVCDAAGTPGICDRDYCIPGCGDGAQDTGEECDDGNFASHDGCSSSCKLEVASWSEWHSAWVGRAETTVAYHVAAHKLVVFGGITENAVDGDHWERDVNGQWQRRDISRPAKRRLGTMSYDSARQMLVLFGGIDGPTAYVDTWEYNGTAWMQRTTNGAPTPRYGAGMFYDTAHAKTVLFGGETPEGALLDDTWEYDGTTATWIKITTTGKPSARVLFATAWDPVRSRGVVFGGISNIGYAGDTWEYNAGTWTSIAGTAPAARFASIAAFSPQRGKLVMFGGQTVTGPISNDTWEYNGAWTPIGPNLVVPPARMYSSFAFDADRNTLVLVGGADSLNLDPMPDVWEYAGAPPAWQQNPPISSPNSRFTRGVYDAARERFLIAGGTSASPDTWTFDGTSWARATNGLPGSRLYNVMTYDSARQRVVLFGGSGGSPYAPARNDTLEWDGTAWQTVPTGAAPPARIGGAIAYDATLQRSVLFGGNNLTNELGDTWEYDGATWTETTGQSPPPPIGTNPALAFDALGQRTIMFDNRGGTWAYTAHAWSQIATTGPVARTDASLTYDPERDRVMMFGGLGLGGELLGDAWELDGTAWTRVDIHGSTPTPRYITAFAHDHAARAYVMFGGNGAGGTLADTQLLQYRSDTPDEDCTNGSDDDGDRQVDAMDPDCK